MKQRKRRGIGFLVSGALFVGVGVVMFVTESTPDIVPTILSIVGTVGEMIGFKIVYPDIPNG